MLNHSSPRKERYQLRSFGTCPEFLTSNQLQCTACWLQPIKCGPEIDQGLGGVTFQTLLGPVSVWIQQIYHGLLKPCRISSPPRVAVPATLFREKARMKMKKFYYVDKTNNVSH